MVRILGTGERTGSVTLPAAENDDYRVTISYDKTNVTNIPDGATVSVTSYADDSDQYATAKAAVIAAKKEKDENFEEDSLGLKALDISILDENKQEIEPDGSVKVSIELKKLPDGVDEGTELEISHIKGTNKGAQSSQAKAAPAWSAWDEEDGETSYTTQSVTESKSSSSVEAETVGNVKAEDEVSAEFSVSSFSTFTVSYNSNSFNRIYVVDSNGNSIGSNKSTTVGQQTYISALSTSANPSSSQYRFVEAKVGSSFANANTTLNSTSGYIYYDDDYGWCYYDGSAQYMYEFGSDNNLYLVYRRSDGNVTVTFDANGGTTTPNPQTMSGRADSTITLPDYTGTRSGYTFKGWSTANTLLSDTYHDLYPAGSTYTVPSEDITLYAVWDSNNYTNTTATFYVRLDGTIPAEPGSFASANYTSGIAIRKDITVQRWIVDTDGTKSITTTGSKNSANNKNYLENDVTAALNSVPTNAQLVTVINASSIGITVADQDGELVVTASTNSNYTVGDQLYVHWYVQKLQDGAKNWHVDGSLRVKDKVTITYDGNPNSEASGVPVSYQTTRGTEVNIGSSGSPNGTVPTTTRTGYVFEGWNTKADGTGTTYQNNDKFTLNENTTLYAMWSKGYNHLTVNKKDESGNVLAGATFTLEEKDGSTWTQVSSGTTSDAGTYVYNNVRSQTIYRLTETYAPNGYETRNSFCFEVTTGTNQEILNIFVVDENGNTIDTPSWLQTSYTQASVSGGSGSISLNITDEAIKRKVEFVKTAADGTTKLSGAKFSLTKGSGDNATIVTGVLAEQSGTDGVFSAGNATLTYGTYTLTETEAPSGYLKASPFTITLNDPTGDAATTDGTYTENTGVTFGDGAPASVSMVRSTSTQDNKVTTTYTYTITVKDTPQADVTVIKTDDKTPATNLGGVTFKLTKQKGSGDSTTWEAVRIANVTSTQEGHAGEFTISDNQKANGVKLTGLDNGTYKLTEIAAPAGYIVQTSDTTFTVGADGKVTLADGQTHASLSTTDGNVLTIKNTAGEALPNTGGSGTAMYTLSGLMLIIASALMYGFISKKRKRETD